MVLHSTRTILRTYPRSMTNENGVKGGLGSTPKRHRFLTRQETVELLANRQADPSLLDDLADLAGDTTDNLGPIR